METQHAHRVLGRCFVAFGLHKEGDQGGGDDGGKLRHPARHQLHPEETHHQPVPNLRHQTLLEYAPKVQNRRSFSHRHLFMSGRVTKCDVCSSSINQTDQMLVHLQSFNSLPENYMIPESTKNGVPLFYIPPGSTTPVPLLLSV